MLRDEEDARDCVQEALLSAHRALGDFEGRARLGTWLHRIATNAALMRLRKRRTQQEEPFEEGLPSFDRFGNRLGPERSNALSPEELLQRADARKRVWEALDALPESYRTVLLLRDIEGFSTRETAEWLETTEGGVRVRLHRARSALKERLRPLFAEEDD